MENFREFPLGIWQLPEAKETFMQMGIVLSESMVYFVQNCLCHSFVLFFFSRQSLAYINLYINFYVNILKCINVKF